jgi:hypothetical protein
MLTTERSTDSLSVMSRPAARLNFTLLLSGTLLILVRLALDTFEYSCFLARLNTKLALNDFLKS